MSDWGAQVTVAEFLRGDPDLLEEFKDFERKIGEEKTPVEPESEVESGWDSLPDLNPSEEISAGDAGSGAGEVVVGGEGVGGGGGGGGGGVGGGEGGGGERKTLDEIKALAEEISRRPIEVDEKVSRSIEQLKKSLERVGSEEDKKLLEVLLSQVTKLITHATIRPMGGERERAKTREVLENLKLLLALKQYYTTEFQPKAIELINALRITPKSGAEAKKKLENLQSQMDLLNLQLNPKNQSAMHRTLETLSNIYQKELPMVLKSVLQSPDDSLAEVAVRPYLATVSAEDEKGSLQTPEKFKPSVRLNALQKAAEHQILTLDRACSTLFMSFIPSFERFLQDQSLSVANAFVPKISTRLTKHETASILYQNLAHFYGQVRKHVAGRKFSKAPQLVLTPTRAIVGLKFQNKTTSHLVPIPLVPISFIKSTLPELYASQMSISSLPPKIQEQVLKESKRIFLENGLGRLTPL